MPRLRPRLLVLLGAALATGGVLASAAPARAVTWDHDPVRATFRFTVAGAPYTLRTVSIGDRTRTIRIGRQTGTVRADYRLTFEDRHGHVLAVLHRGLAKEAYIVDAFAGASFPTAHAFRAAEHRASTVTAAVADAAYGGTLRIESVSADLEASIAATFDTLRTVPEGTRPDFAAVAGVHSSEYRGDVTVSGTDAAHWSVIVRDRRDGYGEFYDDATGSEATFRF